MKKFWKDIDRSSLSILLFIILMVAIIGNIILTSKAIANQKTIIDGQQQIITNQEQSIQNQNKLFNYMNVSNQLYDKKRDSAMKRIEHIELSIKKISKQHFK